MTETTGSVDSIRSALVDFINNDIMAADHAIDADQTLEAAGVDSMGLMRILLFIEEEYGFWIPDDDLTDEVVASARSLAHYVHCHLTGV